MTVRMIEGKVTARALGGRGPPLQIWPMRLREEATCQYIEH